MPCSGAGLQCNTRLVTTGLRLKLLALAAENAELEALRASLGEQSGQADKGERDLAPVAGVGVIHFCMTNCVTTSRTGRIK